MARACRPTAARIFDPYVTGKSGGTGLGLALAADGGDARMAPSASSRRPEAVPPSSSGCVAGDAGRTDPAGRRRGQHPPDAGRAPSRGRVLRRGGRQRQRRPAAGRRRGPGRRPARPYDAPRSRWPRDAYEPSGARPPDAGDHDERQGTAHRRGAGRQAGRLPVPGEATEPRIGAGHRPRGARAQPHPGGEPRAARRAGPRARTVGESAAMQQVRALIARVGPDRGAGPAHRRVRHRQGAGRRGGPRRQPAGQPRLRHRELRGHPARPRRVRDVRARARRIHGRHRAPAGTVRAGPRRAPSFSTRSAT